MRALGRGSVASIIKFGLDIAWVALWIGAAGAATYGAVAVLAGFGFLSDGVFEALGLEIRSGELRLITEDGRVFGWRYLAPALLVGAVFLAGSLVVVWRLKRLFRNFTSGEPFSADNANHMRAIWIALVAIELARYAIMALFGVLSAGSPEGARVDFEFDNLTAWFVILILIVLAEVFREGARLREDEKLTI